MCITLNVREQTKVMYRLCVCVRVYIRSADINDDYTHQQKMSEEFLVRNGSKRPRERNLREMQTKARSQEATWSVFLFYTNFLKKENFKP